LTLAFGSIAIVLAANAALTLHYSRRTARRIDNIVGDALRSVQLLGRMERDLLDQRWLCEEHIIEEDRTEMAGLESRLEASRADYVAAATEYAALTNYPGERKAWHRLEQDVALSRGPLDRVLTLSRQNRDGEAHEQLEQLERLLDAIDFDASALIGINSQEAHEAQRSIELDQQGSLNAQWALWLLSIALTLGIGAIAARQSFRLEKVRLEQHAGELEQRNQQLTAAEATATRAVSARDEVLGIVAHDLRTPLSSILMRAQLLERRPHPEPEVNKQAGVIVGAASRMGRLIQDLLEVTHLEAGEMTLARDQVSVADVIKSSVATFTERAAAAPLELRTDLAEEPSQVWADRERLLQVLDNLIGNALKHTKAGGCLTVGAGPKGEAMLFWVADTGEGIAPEAIPHLFDRFWQATRADRRGVGLGLAIVKGIVEAHGGRVWADSTPGKGSTFFFTIPLTPSAERGVQASLSGDS
jgi:signal transduction histidine kinase